MSELHLFDPGPQTHGLTDRQQKALEALQGAGWDGLTTDELGAILHHPRHSLHDRCEFCGSAGMEVGRALRDRGLACQRRRRGVNGDLYMVWTTSDAQPPHRFEPGDLPAGF